MPPSLPLSSASIVDFAVAVVVVTPFYFSPVAAADAGLTSVGSSRRRQAIPKSRKVTPPPRARESERNRHRRRRRRRRR